MAEIQTYYERPAKKYRNNLEDKLEIEKDAIEAAFQQVYEAIHSGGGLAHWSEDVDGNLIPETDGNQSLGSFDKSLAGVAVKGSYDLYASGAQPVIRIGQLGIQFGAGGDNPLDYAIGYGRDANDAPFLSFGGIYLLKGDDSPVGLATGGGGTTLYLMSDGSLWTKTGSGPTDWHKFQTI